MGIDIPEGGIDTPVLKIVPETLKILNSCPGIDTPGGGIDTSMPKSVPVI